VIAGVIVAAVAVIGLLCTGSIYMLGKDRADRTTGRTFDDDRPFTLPSGRGFPTGDPSAAPDSTGPKAAVSPAKDIYDLNQVCDDNTFFPAAPKRAGKAPHPVALLIKDGPDSTRWQNSVFYLRDEGTSDADAAAWGPDSPAKVQLAACLDRATAGSKIRTCKYDKPKPDTVALHRAGWRLRVYEVATHRLLLDKKLNGDETTCPYSVLVGDDKKIYAQVSDHTAVTSLRNLVKK
jgi:hypothetical protein